MPIDAKATVTLELPRRNAAAVMQELHVMRVALDEGLQLVQRLQTAVSDLSVRLALLETRVNMMAAQRMGSGPTVR